MGKSDFVCVCGGGCIIHARSAAIFGALASVEQAHVLGMPPVDTSGTPCTERLALLQTECANHEALRGAGSMQL